MLGPIKVGSKKDVGLSIFWVPEEEKTKPTKGNFLLEKNQGFPFSS